MKPVTVTGIKQIDYALMALEPKLRKKVMRKAMRPAMKEHIHKEAKANSPKETGELKKQIKVRAAKRSRRYIGVDVLIDGEDGFYHAFQEYGTSKIKPKGFMRRAFDENAGKAKDDVMKIVLQMIEKEAKQQ